MAPAAADGSSIATGGQVVNSGMGLYGRAKPPRLTRRSVKIVGVGVKNRKNKQRIVQYKQTWKFNKLSR